ncbi:MAG: L-seryl-tRNA(Sec) selenium transferase [Vicinamibacterales bacterium]
MGASLTGDRIQNTGDRRIGLVRIPSIDALLAAMEPRAWIQRHGRPAVVAALREAAAVVRDEMRGGSAPSAQQDIERRLSELALNRLEARALSSLRRVINATGVILHTNLGRAPVSNAALERMATVGAGYASVEYDIAAGARGRRDVHAEPLLRELTGAEAAVAVNNNAAATLLVLTALAAGRDVLVSRGELVEIGGGFRVPDVMAQSGAILREVGTTNKTRASDYAAAISDRTGLILRVHPSNFRIEGFTARPALAELTAIARQFELPLYEDLGSGLLAPDARFPAEPSARESLDAGADVVSFSGDKLLGGPQAGIIAGRADLLDQVRRHPLMRALRLDKLACAALEATLQAHAAGRAAEELPIWRMIALTAAEIDARAAGVVAALPPSFDAEIIEGQSAIGGGSAPDVELPTSLIALTHKTLSATALEAALRASPTPVIARIQDGRVLLDLRTVGPDEDAVLMEVLKNRPD